MLIIKTQMVFRASSNIKALAQTRGRKKQFQRFGLSAKTKVEQNTENERSRAIHHPRQMH